MKRWDELILMGRQGTGQCPGPIAPEELTFS